MERRLTEKILQPGVENVNFFEGRLLTGRDLRDQLAADREVDHQLGRGIGAGVVDGLEVSVFNKGGGNVSPQLEVTSGRAINPEGRAMRLFEKTKLTLTRSLGSASNGSLFQECANPSEAFIPNGIGVYILTLAPASGLLQEAPAVGLESNGVIASCGKRYDVEGVLFRLVQLVPAQLSAISEATKTRLRDQLLGAGDLNSRSLIRNLVAYLCFGAEEPVPLEENPFATIGGESALLRFGVVDDLRNSGVIASCEVPLALLYWTFDGVGFLDSWAVRRRALPQTVSPGWPGFGHWRRRVEAEARFLQFQNHLAWLISEVPNPALIQARAYFRYLPPTGFLPIAQGANAGVSETIFFNGLTAREPVFMEGARVPPLIDRSFAYPALDLDDQKVIWRYMVRENRMPGPGEQQPSEPPYLVFAKGHLPYQGDAQFDIAHWDFSNYAPGVSF